MANTDTDTANTDTDMANTDIQFADNNIFVWAKYISQPLYQYNSTVCISLHNINILHIYTENNLYQVQINGG